MRLNNLKKSYFRKANPLIRIKNKLKNDTTPLPSSYRQQNTKLTKQNEWGKIKLKLKSMSKEKTAEIFTQVLNDAWSVKTINYTNLRKGRSESDTKSVINYMIMALYRMKLDEQSDFDSIRFFDQVIFNPAEVNDFLNFLCKYFNLSYCLKVSPDGLFEQDIVLSKDQAHALFSKYFVSNETVRDRRKVVRNSVYRWPIPIHYYFDGSHNEQEKVLIKSAIKRWEENTCLEFKQILNKSEHPHYLRFFKGPNGCWSPVGYSMYSHFQDISLGSGCLNKGTILVNTSFI